MPTDQQVIPSYLRWQGELMSAGGNRPIALDDPASAWIVLAGKVDVFAVQLESGQPVGIRRHLFRAEPGHALFGMDLNRPLNAGSTHIGLLASGVPGTQVLKLELARLKDVARDPAQRTDVIGLIESWVSGLAAGIAPALPPRKYVTLEPDQETALEHHAIAMTPGEVLWVKHQAGDSRLMGRPELRVSSDDGWLPLTRRTWLQSVAASSLQPVRTRDYFDRDPDWLGLAHFHRLALDCIMVNLRRAERSENSRLRDKAELDRRVTRNAVSRLAAVLGLSEPQAGHAVAALTGQDRGESLYGLAPDEPLLSACRAVGRASGVTIQPLPGARDKPMSDPLDTIARTSRLRIRRVALRGEWWREDNGPLLAFTEETKHPVALLSASPTRYEMFDAVELKTTPVTPQAAATLAPFAYTFYRPFSEPMFSARHLIRFGLRGSGRDLGMVVLMGLAGGSLGMLMPLVTGWVFDHILPGADGSRLVQVCLALGASALAAALFQLVRGLAIVRVEGRLGASLQAAVWDRLLSLPAPFFRGYSAGDLADRAMGIEGIRQVLSGATILSILATVFSLFNFILLFFFDSRLAWAATGLVLIIVAVTTLAGYLQMRYRRTLTDLQGRISGLVLQFITGIAKLRVAGAETRAFAYWAREYSVQRRLTLKVRHIANALAVFNAVYPILTLVIVFAMIAAMGQSRLSTGSFLAFNAAFSQFLLAGLQVSAVLLSALSIVPMYERIQPILQAQPEVDQAKSDPGELTGEIEMSHVNFRYDRDGPLVLRDVSLHIRPSEFVALVGPSGSGKSTLLRLLLGFELPGSGAVYYDGQDLAGLDIRAVRKQLGVVLQNGKLMAGDVFTNIVGASLLTVEDAWEAARLAGLEQDIEQMPMGMHTIVSEGGSTLSGGQRQRLLIARALVHKPRVLFFDEATSALDNVTQAVVSQSLASLRATRVVIAHRLSTIRQADWILVLEAGRVVQSGTYAELIGQPGLFADLVKRQLA